MSAAAPPGWYPDPAAGRMRWWDGVSWHDPPPGPATAPGALPFGAPPSAPPRRSRTPWIIAGVVGAVLLVSIVLLVPALVTPSWRQEAERVQAALLVPAELGVGWTTVDASVAAQTDPFSKARAADPGGGLAICPDRRDAFAAGSSRLPELGASGDAFGDDTYLGLAAERQGVRQSVATFHDDNDAEAYARTIGGWLTCTATWEVEGEDGWRWQVSSEPVDAQPFGPDVIAGKLRVDPVQVGDVPEGVPDGFDPTQPAELTYLARLDGHSVMVIGTTGMTDDQVLEVWRTADHKMFGS